MATVRTFIGHVKGEKGDQGIQGVPGVQGERGPQGNPTAVNGLTGESITLKGSDIPVSADDSRAVAAAIAAADGDISGLTTRMGTAETAISGIKDGTTLDSFADVEAALAQKAGLDTATQSDNGLMSAADKTKLDGVAVGATANAASDDVPAMDGTAAAGSASEYARGDHVHPTDISRASASDLSAIGGRVTANETAISGIKNGATLDSFADVEAADTELHAQTDPLYTAQQLPEAAVQTFSSPVDGEVLQDVTVHMVPVQSGGGDPSPDNVRPISGWTGTILSVYKDNLVDYGKMIRGKYIGTNGSLVNAISSWYATSFVPVSPNTTYTFSGMKNSAVEAASIAFYDRSKNFLRSVSTKTTSNKLIVNTEGAYYTRASAYSNSGIKGISLAICEGNDVILKDRDCKTIYPQFSGIDLDGNSLPGTVYGGTLNVSTGELTVTMANIASYAGEAIGEPWVSSMDVYVSGATPTTGAQVVYTLATPITYHLTPQQIRTLLGTNNVYADAGNISLTVRGDLANLYSLDSSKAETAALAPVESGTASRNYNSGDYLALGGRLYKAAAAIATGEALTIGTNITPTTVAAELAALAALINL